MHNASKILPTLNCLRVAHSQKLPKCAGYEGSKGTTSEHVLRLLRKRLTHVPRGEHLLVRGRIPPAEDASRKRERAVCSDRHPRDAGIQQVRDDGLRQRCGGEGVASRHVTSRHVTSRRGGGGGEGVVNIRVT